MTTRIKVGYTGVSVLEGLDSVIKDQMKKEGWKWVGSGFNFVNKVREIIFEKQTKGRTVKFHQ